MFNPFDFNGDGALDAFDLATSMYVFDEMEREEKEERERSGRSFWDDDDDDGAGLQNPR